MHPILFTLHGLIIYTHGFLAVIGIIVTSILLYYLAGKIDLDRSYMFDKMIYVVLFGIIGSRLNYFFLYRDQFSNWKEIFYLQDGGMVSYGGFLLGLIAFIVLFRKEAKKLVQWLDIFAISFCFGLFFGRLGNIMAGEYAGKISVSKFAIDYYIPVTLYEGILVLLIGIVLLVFFLKNKRANGFYFPLFLFLYGTGRFVIDFWRDDKNIVGPFGLSQIISLTIAILGLLFLLIRSRKKYKELNDFR